MITLHISCVCYVVLSLLKHGCVCSSGESEDCREGGFKYTSMEYKFNHLWNVHSRSITQRWKLKKIHACPTGNTSETVNSHDDFARILNIFSEHVASRQGSCSPTHDCSCSSENFNIINPLDSSKEKKEKTTLTQGTSFSQKSQRRITE